MDRVIAYVDGFNLYFGMKSMGWRRYYWLDVQQLARQLLRPSQQLVSTKYFTSRVSATPGDPDKNRRQNTYLEALGTLPDLSIRYGHYLQKRLSCGKCKATWETYDEKMTDVNIAVEMMADAFQDRFDVALLVSGDSDLSAPVEAVSRLFPSKRVVVAFPPNRVSKRLQLIATDSFVIGRRKFALSQLPDEVPKSIGFILRRPASWH